MIIPELGSKRERRSLSIRIIYQLRLQLKDRCLMEMIEFRKREFKSLLTGRKWMFNKNLRGEGAFRYLGKSQE